MKITSNDVLGYINSLDKERIDDINVLVNLFKRITNKEPLMWGNIIGFGNLHYKYKTGHSGDMPLLALASRKQAITLYVSYTLDKYDSLKKLGKHKTGVSCLYIKKLSDIDINVLEELLIQSISDTLSLDFITDNDKVED